MVHNYDTIFILRNVVGAIHTLEMTTGEMQNVPQVHRFQLFVNGESKRSNFYSL